jgi:hypothetical protein
MRAAPGITLAALAAAAPLHAQQDSSLRAAVQLATEGRGDSARAVVRSRLGGAGPDDSLLPEVLYTAGVVAADADSASHYFRRVSIEFSRSDWAAPALLRLAQIAFGTGDYAGALRSARRVISDYPFSPVRADASFWAGRASFELGGIAEGCRLVQAARDGAADNIELAYRAAYHLQRCTATTARDSAPPDSAAPRPAPAPGAPPARVGYAVQVAAVQNAAAADELMQRLNAAGYEPQVVRDSSGFFKVRVGRFPARDDAVRVAAELKRLLGGDPFVVEQR